MNENWTEEEFRICVRQYWKAVKNKGTENEIDRKAFVRGALVGSLKARGEGSVQRRMCNISALMEKNGQPWVIGWKPLHNVGAGVTPRLEQMLREVG